MKRRSHSPPRTGRSDRSSADTDAFTDTDGHPNTDINANADINANTDTDANRRQQRREDVPAAGVFTLIQKWRTKTERRENMSKRTLHGLTFVLLGMAMALLLQGHPARVGGGTGAPGIGHHVGGRRAVLTQTFSPPTADGTIYLEVNPLNTSLLVDPDGDGPPPAACRR
ncbi:MAG: hypothetical protein R2873_34365 [Caldilineaceae bacterium]